MEEKTLLKIAFIFSIVGVVALFLVSENIAPQEIKISEISCADSGKDVKIHGRIAGVDEKEDIVVISVAQEKIIKVVAFKDGKLNLQKGQVIEVEGEVRNYKGNLEIVADKMKVER